MEWPEGRNELIMFLCFLRLVALEFLYGIGISHAQVDSLAETP